MFHPNPVHPNYRRVRHPSEGSVLLITLLVVSLLMVLVLSLTVWVRVELRAVTNHQHVQEARANARMALMLAVGELQVLTGPDRRITATAQLARNSPAVRNPHWTGVWRNAGTSSILPGESTSSPQLLSWLVSGNEAVALPSGTGDALPAFTPYMNFNRNTPQLAPGSNENAVTLLGGGSVELSTYDADGDGMEDGGGIVAPLVSIRNPEAGVSGRYAYWIGDEGVKARINLIDPYSQAATDSPEGRARRASPPRSAAELFVRDSTPTSALWGELYRVNDPANARVLSANNLSFALNTDSATAQRLPKTSYHDLSVLSESLFVDAKNGGLKFDLTTATRFEGVRWSAFKNLVSPVSPEQLFPPVGGTRTFKDPGGPYWNVVKSFVQDGADSNGIVARAQDLDQHGFAPIIQEFKMFSGPSITGTGTGRGIRMHYMPVVILWNPYDRTLKAQDYYIVFGPLDPDINVHVGLSPDHWATTGNPSDRSDRNAPLRFPHTGRKRTPELERDRAFRFRIQAPDLPPGRAMVFSPPEGGQPMKVDASIPYQAGDFNILLPGWREGDANYYMDCGPLRPQPLAEEDIIYHLSLYGDAGGNTDLWMGVSPAGVRENPVSLLNNALMFSLTGYLNQPNNYDRVTLSGSPRGSPLNLNEILDGAGNYIAEPIFGYWLQLRMSEQTGSNAWDMTIPFLRSYNPRGPLHSSSYLESRSGASTNNSFRTFATYFRGLLTSNFESIDSVNSIGAHTFPGFSSSSIIGDRFISFRAFEGDTDVFSIGDLMHANLIPDLGDVEANIHYRHIGANYPAYAVGSSAQSPYIEKNSTSAYRNTWPVGTNNRYQGGNDSMFYDLPYLLNEALWDRFYFSAIDAAGNETRNPRYQKRTQGFLEPYNPDDARSFASSHTILGGFNVNSTSVDAWAAVLGAYLGIPSELNPSVPEHQGLLDRVAFPEGDPYESGETADADSAWSGSRLLDATEIRALAAATVEEVKSRGPFLSLADFVNRNLKDAGAGEARKRGALDAAIKAAGLNSSLAESIGGMVLHWEESDFPQSGQNQFNLHNMEALTEPITDHIPGALSQPDLLAKFGSILTVRSDTFIVRFYGDTLEPVTGKPLARVWGEATIQRIIEPVEPSAQNAQEPSDPSRDRFGRRYTITNLRWLHSDDI